MLYERLYPEQAEAVDFVLPLPAAALFFEQRTGKTFITMGVLEKLDRSSLAAVVVCLLNNRDSTWRDKLAEHLPWLNVTSDWNEFKRLPFPKLFLVHLEGVSKVASKLKRAKWITFCVIDEAHRIKARGSAMSRACARLASIPKRLILTGTPMDKSQKDLWAQFRFLVPGLLFKRWADFEEEFMEWRKIDLKKFAGTYKWREKLMLSRMLRSRATFNKRKASAFVKLIAPYCMRMTKQDVGIIPPTIEQVVVPILGRQRRSYETFSRDHVLHLDDDSRVMAPLEITAIMKKRQLASGFVYDDDEELHLVGSAKLRKLLYYFRVLPKPIVVFTVFNPELEMVRDALVAEGYDIITVSGKTKKNKRADLWRNFQGAMADGIICQIKTGGVGVDLWKASYGMFLSITHSGIDFDQAKSRMDHKSKKKPNRFLVLCSEGTIDMDLYDLVVDKGINAEDVLKQLKRKERRHGKGRKD